MPKEKFEQYIDNYIKDFSKKYNISPKYAKGCLCESDRELLVNQKIALIHPHNNLDCHRKISEVILNTPNIEFYLFALGGGGGKRIKNIGSFPNLTPIRDEGDLEKLSREIRKI